MEDKHEKFIRLAESRTNSAIKSIQLIGNLANRSNYEYSKEEITELFKALEKEIQLAKRSFEWELEKKDRKFKFTRR
ncbi:MAG: hypothetical protein DI638_04090 [Gemella sp.]|nr:MAG: hypothetical protein DI638_04090 [Gemella sp.]